ncbi:hypothetical protein BCU68_04665 [Vibrio sp. 10N.286.49.B3]|uniref:hypothetical protein n=1 Tax=Vibrio sp. 10N.286.49.B3 TaxID=1880855 RepID=UPI000C863C6B|nr:hypothetical protein [Vibrio sp. 10N.286.49.B3]PMH43281.1 hypothetical protein BCU68_04665 [Vibrio sp. 10N.286.49.B3]
MNDEMKWNLVKTVDSLSSKQRQELLSYLQQLEMIEAKKQGRFSTTDILSNDELTMLLNVIAAPTITK